MNKRQLKILELVSKYKKIDVSELAKQCDVSSVTIRKDLDTLEHSGLLRREHGFALVNNEDNINYRLAIGYEQKHAIARKALTFIEANETIMIESGSTCTLLALEIAKRNQNNTIITNSTFIARYLKDYPSTKVIIVAGIYQPASEAITGPLIRTSLQAFTGCKLFIGTDGIDVKYGFTGSDYERCESVKIMKEKADQVFVLSQSYKLHKHANYTLFPLQAVQYLISDDDLSDTDKKLLEKHHIHII